VLDGLNLVGLMRGGAARAEIAALRDLLEALAQGAFRETARVRAEAGSDSALVREVLDFILGPSDRSFLAPR
jgi:UDP-N-acetylglucosamine acyltransferase